ncbi:hypothetical protein BDC45DRAFT_532593 [Circinella umbellata]|nr:hypothetical protein BDC45DRAFT_532593 [Circinella umbellata]
MHITTLNLWIIGLLDSRSGWYILINRIWQFYFVKVEIQAQKLIASKYSLHDSAGYFSNARNLRDHYENVEGIKYPSTRSRLYNTKTKKYISGLLAKSRHNVTENFGCPSCTSHFNTTLELGNHLNRIHTANSRAEVDECFNTLKHNNKWILSTGKIVEDSLYAFGKLQIGDHPSQSLIFDLGDTDSYIKNGVFTEQEIEEIKAYKSPKHVQKALNEKQSWEECYNREKHFDLDWIKHSVYTLVREYENSSLMKDHLENWYNIHIWCMIDHIFGDVEGLEIIRGEGVSVASSIRKSLKRTIEDVNNHARKPMGHRFDFLIRETNPKSTNSFEYGASEVDKSYNSNGNKMIKERGIKLPKVLKDMLDILAKENKGGYSNLCTVGVVHSGLHMKVIIADRPKGYTTRIIDGKALQIPVDIISFGEKVLPILVQVYHLKVLVKNVFELVRKNDKKITDDSDWLDHCLDKTPTNIIPVTSTSTETQRLINGITVKAEYNY